MAYQTGVPASTEALIDTFIAWLVAEAGFALAGSERTYNTSNVWLGNTGTSGLNWTSQALSRDGQFALLAWPTTAPNRLALNSASANPASGLINEATDSSANNTVIELGTSPLRYWMFADGNSGHMVVEWVGGAFQHVSIGYVQKYGAFTGGLYITGMINNRQNVDTGSVYFAMNSSNAGYHGYPFNGRHSTVTSNAYAGHLRATYGSNKIHAFGGYSSSTGGVASNVYIKPATSMQGILPGFGSSWLLERSPNAYNGRSLLIPVELIIGATDSQQPASWVPVGRVNNAAFVNIANLNPTDLVLTDWMVFPWSAKNSGGSVASGYVNSLNYGMAYRK